MTTTLGIAMTRTDKLTYLARAGLAAKAVVYAAFGALALLAALGERGVPTKENLAQQVGAVGVALLWLTGFGLLFYAAWRGAQAIGISDEQRDENDGKELAKRVGAAGSMLANGALGVFFIASAGRAGSDGGGGWSGLLDSLWGRLVVGGVAIGMLIAGVYQIVVGVQERFMRNIRVDRHQVREILRKVGRAAFAARGVIFLLIGGGLLVSALQAGKSESTSIGGALRTLAEQPFGPWLLAAVALGLLAYGVVTAVMSRYVRAQGG